MLFEHFLNLEYIYEVPKIRAQLNNMDIDVGILSNGNDNMLRPLSDNSELGENINTVMSVNEIKQYKPSPASYALILKYHHLKREEILFVSSNSKDETGTSNIGFDK